MAKRLWCVLLTAVMLLNLLPVGLAEEIGPESAETIVETLAEPAPAAETQSEVQEVIEEPLPAEVEIQPEEEAAEEALPDEEEPESLEEAAEEPEEEAAEELLPDEADGSIEILTIPGEELPDMLMAAAARPEDEEIVEEEEEDGGEENRSKLPPDELIRLGIDPTLTVYELTSDYETIRSGIYAITQDVVNNDYYASISGSVTIYLPDGYRLNFTRGLNVGPDASLTIRKPERDRGTGILEARGETNQAGIGGGYRESAGIIKIYGGVIRAYGGQGAAGIGGGNDGGGGGYVEIHGGSVEAYGSRYGAGIGGGNGGYGGAKIITGGTVYAKGGELAAGIGGGSRGHCDGEIQINDNNGTNVTNVTAEGGANAAGIGGGNGHGNTRIVTISGSKVTVKATGGVNAAGIGGGSDGSGGTVNITGGTVTATGGTNAAGIGGGNGGRGGPITITGGTVTATGNAGAAGIGGGSGDSGGVITISGGTVTATGGANDAGKGGGTGIGSGRNGGSSEIHILGGTVTAQGGVWAAGIGSPYQGGSTPVTISNAVVTATGGIWAAGIGSGTESIVAPLTITNAVVTATGGDNGSGIGSDGASRSSTIITITDSVITATGTGGGAGIGGGNGAPAGEVTISGSTVTAQGGTRVSWWAGAAGIGTGAFTGAGGKVTINGGRVAATGGHRAAGIGGGCDSGGCDITISDGTTVMAVAGLGCSSAIGPGHRGRLRGSLKLGAHLIVVNSSNDKKPVQINNPSLEDVASASKVVIGENLVLHPMTPDRLVYNGKEQVGYLNPVMHTHVEGQTSGTDAGDYTFTVTLDPGYIWSDFAEGAKVITWTISRLRATVRADDRTTVYGEGEPKLTATVRGVIDNDTLNYRLTREPGKDVGRYRITSSGAPIQGNYDVAYQPGTLTIRPKNVSANRSPESQTIEAGSGTFTEPSGFHDMILDEDIPGTLSYTYNRRQITKAELENVLGGLRAGSSGTIGWRYTASGNFTGTITGSILYSIESTAHTHRFVYAASGNQLTARCRDNDCPLHENGIHLTLTAPADLVYDGYNKDVTFAEGEAEAWGTATFHDVPRITYTADRGSALTGGNAVNAGSYTASVSANGQRASLRFTITKADYADVTKEVSGELKTARGTRLTITLPEIPEGARYGRPYKNRSADGYSLSWITKNLITVTAEGISQTSGTVSFTVPVIAADNNHNGYDIIVTLTLKSTPHTHSFTYRAIGNQLTALCLAADCPLEDTVRLTLNAPKNLSYDGSAKEAFFTDDEMTAWKDATGNDAPRITYTADRDSALTGGKPVNAGSYTAISSVNGHTARLKFTVSKADYAGVIKEISGGLYAGSGSSTTITLPAIPQGASYGHPVKAVSSDNYTLSRVNGNQVTLTSRGIREGTKTVSFSVPVRPDGNHNGYTVTVTVNILKPKFNVSVKISPKRIQILPRVFLPGYTASITVDSTEAGTQDLRVEYSTNGRNYTVGNEMTSLTMINHFYIRVTDSAGAVYNFEYSLGRVIPR